MLRVIIRTVLIAAAMIVLASCATGGAGIEIPVPGPFYEAHHPGQILASPGRGDHLIDPEIISAVHGDYAVIVRSSGAGMLMDREGGYTEISLPLEEHFFVETLFFADTPQGLLFVYGDSDGDAGGSEAVLLSRDGKTMLWHSHVYGFNIGYPVIYKGHAYLSTIGFVGKLSLETGEFAWKHEGLYRQHGGEFNSFEVPVIEGGSVYFIERCSSCARKMLVVDDETGGFEVRPHK